MKKPIITILAVLLLFGVTSCFTQKVAVAQPPPAVHVPKFDYSPPTYDEKDTSRIALILLNPFYLGQKNADRRNERNHTLEYLGLNCFDDFKTKMGIDFEEALTARGYTIKGPYQTEDEIVYSDKRNSDLLVSVEIDVNINDDNVKAFRTERKLYTYGGAVNVEEFTYRGTLILDGKINIIIRAVTKTGFGDKLSVRSVPIDRKEIQINSYKTNYPDADMYRVMATDPGIINPIADELEKYYNVMFNKVWRYLEPGEFAEYKKLAQEIRNK